jgi:hypothetical protein
MVSLSHSDIGTGATVNGTALSVNGFLFLLLILPLLLLYIMPLDASTSITVAVNGTFFYCW